MLRLWDLGSLQHFPGLLVHERQLFLHNLLARGRVEMDVAMVSGSSFLI